MDAGHHDLGTVVCEVVAVEGKSDDCKEIVFPIWLSPHTGGVHRNKLSLGSRDDSYDEY